MAERWEEIRNEIAAQAEESEDPWFDEFFEACKRIAELERENADLKDRLKEKKDD
jgi:hypothetical protein